MKTFAAAALAALIAAPSLAEGVKIGEVTIEKAWSRATPKGAEVGVAFLTIRNAGAADKLVSMRCTCSTAVEVHEMSMTNGIMKMRELPKGLDVPAKGEVKLSPQGIHLMLMGLKTPLVKGQTISLDLEFVVSGIVHVDAPVEALGASVPSQ